MALPFPRFLTYVYAWLIEGGSPEGIEAMDKKVFDPPAGLAKEDLAELPQFKNAGANFMAQFGARVTADPFADRKSVLSSNE